MTVQFILYGAIASAYSEKIELALKEGSIHHRYFLVNLFSKPAFFTEKINPIGRVPAITYGGPDVPAEESSPLSTKLTESNVILEFLADAYPEAKLMPTDPAQRVRVRFIMGTITRKYMPAYMEWIMDCVPQAAENLLKVIGLLQGSLSEAGEYAVGNCYTLADASVIPFVHRLYLAIDNDIGKFPVGYGPKLGESLKDDAKFVTYGSAAMTRPVAKGIYELKKNEIVKIWIQLMGREQRCPSKFKEEYETEVVNGERSGAERDYLFALRVPIGRCIRRRSFEY